MKGRKRRVGLNKSLGDDSGTWGLEEAVGGAKIKGLVEED